MKATLDERQGIGELDEIERWHERRHEVDGELTWTLNLLDRVEDDTRRLYERMLRETKSTYGGPSIREIETETLYALDDIYES